MKISLLLFTLFGYATGCIAQYKNIKIADNVLMPAIDVNIKNPENIVIAAGADLIHYSSDGGKTWHEGRNKFASPTSANPILKSDAEGELFLVHSGEAEIAGKKVRTLVAQTSKSFGKSFSDEVVITSSPREKTNATLVIHPKKSKLAVAWTEADALSSPDPACHSEILYSELGGGDKWSVPRVLSQMPGDCAGKENMLHDPSLTMDDAHKVFASWESAGNFVMDRSYDAGKTWLSGDMPVLKMDGAYSYSIPGLNHAERVPTMVADNSKSVFQNSLYIAWADQRNGPNDTDIWLATSIRRGDSWNPPIKVNKDSKGKHQFMPAVTVDPVTGVIYLVYYDRRNYSDNETDVYLAWSTDGGTKFSEVKISEAPFTPVETVPFTDYIGISAVNGVIAPVWVRMDDGKTSLWTTVISQDDLIQAVDLPKIRVVAKPQHGSNSIYSAPVQQKFKRKSPLPGS